MTKTRTPGTGSIYPDAAGGWRAQLTINGKMVRRRAKTRREAHAKLRELEQLRAAQINLTDGKQTVKTWCGFWLDTLLPGKQAKLKTIEGHRDTCEHYIYPHLGEISLIKLTAQHIDAWQQALRAKGLSEGTVANARRRLSAALEAARKRKVVGENVVLLTDAPTAVASRRAVLNEAQVVRLLDTLAEHRLYALYALAVTTGLRQAELMGLRWPAVDLPRGELEVREQLQRIHDADGKPQLHRETPKTAAGHRSIPLITEQIEFLTRHQAAQQRERDLLGKAWAGEDLVFTNEDGKPLESGALYRQFKRALARAGLPAVTFHSLRHSAGSIMLAHEASLIAVSHILGHSSPAVTAKIYAHSFDEGRRQAVAAAVAAIIQRSA